MINKKSPKAIGNNITFSSKFIYREHWQLDPQSYLIQIPKKVKRKSTKGKKDQRKNHPKPKNSRKQLKIMKSWKWGIMTLILNTENIDVEYANLYVITEMIFRYVLHA